MRSGTTIYAGVAVLLAMSALFDACMCELVGCESHVQRHVASVSGGAEGCCGASNARHDRGEPVTCCEPIALEAIAPPEAPRVSAGTQAYHVGLVPEVEGGRFAFSTFAVARDGPLKLPTPLTSKPRQTRAPPPFAA
ncbi:MAG: hypothetical protein ACOX9R_06045 [Armatimonadota bacterium]